MPELVFGPDPSTATYSKSNSSCQLLWAQVRASRLLPQTCLTKPSEGRSEVSHFTGEETEAHRALVAGSKPVVALIACVDALLGFLVISAQ